jgi:membrane associated rhomboid family serine protease
MLVCSGCRLEMVATRDGEGQWICPKCRARVLAMGSLERLLTAGFTDQLRSRIDAGPAVAGAACPSCRRTMGRVAVAPGESANTVEIELDYCRGCDLLQLDRGEFEELPRKPRVRTTDALAQRRALAGDTISWEDERARERRRWRDDLDDLSWLARILMYLGVPVDADAPVLTRPPLFTWSVAGLLAVSFLLLEAAGDDAWRALAWIPAEPWRLGGLTLVTNFLVHGSWLHLLGNLYFLLVFGRGVEGRIGRARMAVLLLVATIVGNVLHAAFDPRRDLPCIGASGGLSALIVFYVFTFPWNRFAFVGWIFFFPRVLNVPAILWVFGWFAWQLADSLLQHFGGGTVSSFAHLGGALSGFAAWLVWRRRG